MALLVEKINYKKENIGSDNKTTLAEIQRREKTVDKNDNFEIQLPPLLLDL